VSSIVVLGSANLDIAVHLPTMPVPGETVFGDGLASSPGGKGLNQAVAAALAGGDVAFVGAVGDDPSGTLLRRQLESAGVDVAGLTVVDAPTGTALITVLADADNAIVVAPGANDVVTELDDVAAGLVRSARYLVAQLERPAQLVRQGFELARRHGVLTVLTPAPVSRMEPDLFDLVDFLIANASEARALTGVDDDLEAARALSRRVGTAVVTRGALGVVAARAGDIVAEAPARRVRAVDTTGAGDTFAGVLVTALSWGSELPEALRSAVVAASISVTRRGAAASMPTRTEIEAASTAS
jgi:ribokinase